MAAHGASGHARRVARADHGADRRARDRDGLDGHLVERLDDGDMREAARAARAQR